MKLAIAATVLVACGAQPPPVGLKIEHVTIVSPELAAPLVDATVLIDGETIVSILPGATSNRRASRVIDGHGLFLVPGLIDGHVHTGLIAGMMPEQEQAHPDIARAARAQIPRSFLAYGFTTLVDFNGMPALVDTWNAQPVHPDLAFCGGAMVADGYPRTYVPQPLRDAMMPYFLDGGSGAHSPDAVVARMKADGAICIKTFFERGFGGAHDLPVPSLDTVRELVRVGRANDMPVAIHANTTEAHTFAVDAGVAIVAHGMWNWTDRHATELGSAEQTVLDRELAAKLGWEPTLQVLHGLQDLFDPAFLHDPELARVLPASLLAWYATPEGQWFHDSTAATLGLAAPASTDAGAREAREIYSSAIAHAALATRYIATHGGHLLFGTDTPSAPIYTNPPGLNGWHEMQHLIEAGVTPMQLFHAATIDNARAFGLDKIVGTVEAGKRANLVLLAADPTISIDAYRTIREVILRGRVLEPAELVAH